MINKNNYLDYLDDFIHGKLSAGLEAEFVAFLEQNPELASFSMKEAEEAKFPNKSSLKKKAPVHAKNIDEWLIANLEGDLKAAQQNELDSFLRLNPSYKSDQEKYRKTILSPDASIKYPFKSRLKKAGVFQLYYRYAAAAAVIIFLSLWFIFKQDTSQNQFTDIPVKNETLVKNETESIQPVKPKEVLVSDAQVEQKTVETFEEVKQVNSEQRMIRQAVMIEPLEHTVIKPSLSGLELAKVNTSAGLNPLPAVLNLEPREKTLTLLDYYYEEVRPKIPGSGKKAAEETLVKDVRGLVGSNLGNLLHTVRNVRVVVAADK